MCFSENWAGFNDILVPVPGNHDYGLDKNGRRHHGAFFFDHFRNYPFVSRCDEKDVRTNRILSEHDCAERWYKKGYFVFNFPDSGGAWRIVGLNDNMVEPRYEREFSSQVQWLREQLDTTKGNNQRCVLAFWHAPVFSSGQHGHEDYKHPRRNARAPSPNRKRQAVLDLLYRHGASVVLAAHDHNYEQFGPHDANGQPAPDGIRSFVVGTAGADLTKDFYNVPAATSERGPFGEEKGNHGVLKIDLYQDGYVWEFLQIGEESERKDMPRSPPFVACNQRKTP